MDCCLMPRRNHVLVRMEPPCGFLAGPKQYLKLTTIVSGPKFDSAVVYADATP